jgi:hypothetical protein
LCTAPEINDIARYAHYKIEKILTDNGVQFTNRGCDKKDLRHIFDRICIKNAIERRLAKTEYECAIQEATVNKYFYKDYDELN